jgi:biopolymer transport protein TolR
MSGGLLEGPRDDDAMLAEINVTPLVDVVLVLLVIFMITAPLLTANMQVELPEVSTTSPLAKASLVITIGEQGTIGVDDRIVSLEDAVARAQAAQAGGEGSIFLRADSGVSYGFVVNVLDRLRAEGVSEVRLVTQLVPSAADADTPRPPAKSPPREKRRR